MLLPSTLTLFLPGCFLTLQVLTGHINTARCKTIAVVAISSGLVARTVLLVSSVECLYALLPNAQPRPKFSAQNSAFVFFIFGLIWTSFTLIGTLTANLISSGDNTEVIQCVITNPVMFNPFSLLTLAIILFILDTSIFSISIVVIILLKKHLESEFHKMPTSKWEYKAPLNMHKVDSQCERPKTVKRCPIEIPKSSKSIGECSPGCSKSSHSKTHSETNPEAQLRPRVFYIETSVSGSSVSILSYS